MIRKHYQIILFVFLQIVIFCPLIAQKGASISGNLQSSGSFFFRDSLIGAANTPQYDHQLFGAETWVNLNYSYQGFDVGVRFDMFNNSNILSPLGSYTDEGIGRWYVSKKIKGLGITAGYIYDQIGSGIIYRAYEQRPLLIDQALKGLRLTYDITDDWKAKVFTGRQKQQFDVQAPIIKGANIEGYFTLGDTLKPITFAPGIGIISRTLDDATTQSLVSAISLYTLEDSIGAKYNTYATSLYNTSTFGPFTLYVEGAYKTAEAFFDPLAEKTNIIYDAGVPIGKDTSLGKFIFDDGSVLYGSLSYADHGLSLTGDVKRTENFSLRATPFLRLEKLNDGLINFLPPMTRVNTYRLLARYNAATQELGEMAYQFDASYRVNKKLSINANFSDIKDLKDVQLYREIFTEIVYKKRRKYQILGGVQLQNYNQNRFETKPGVPMVETITPYFEFLKKFTRKKSLRIEGQYMITGKDDVTGDLHDYGHWAFALAEYSIAPSWTFTLSDMYNASPGKNSPVDDNGEKLALHYPRVDVFYTHKNNRFSLSYIKQVEGVVCSGGICRLEPAFSGVRMTVNSNF